MECENRASEETRCRLLDACEIGDANALSNATEQGQRFLSAMLDRAAIRGHFACIDVITRQKNVCVSGLAVEYLAKHHQLDVLNHLATKNAISMAGLLTLCNLACESQLKS